MVTWHIVVIAWSKYLQGRKNSYEKNCDKNIANILYYRNLNRNICRGEIVTSDIRKAFYCGMINLGILYITTVRWNVKVTAWKININVTFFTNDLHSVRDIANVESC